jgi:predicted DNA-binding protein (UPF0251 family)
LCSSCARNVRDVRAGDQKSPTKILIAASESEFKKDIIEGIIARYSGNAALRVIRLNSLRGVSTRDYAAIVLIDRALAWNLFNFAVKKFVKEAEEKNKIVVFMTVNSQTWNASFGGVDTITSASQSDSVDGALERIFREIDRRLGQASFSADTEAL